MKIEITVAEDTRSLVDGRPELWLRVLSNELVDLGRAKLALNDEQRELLAQYNEKPVSYYPDIDDQYPYADWWIFQKKVND